MVLIKARVKDKDEIIQSVVTDFRHSDDQVEVTQTGFLSHGIYNKKEEDRLSK